MNDVLRDLAEVIEARKDASAAESYVASLYAGGIDAILRKVGEEAIEVVIAGKDGDREALVRELADLWFHCLVLLAARGSHPQAITDELGRRFGISGHEEKARPWVTPAHGRASRWTFGEPPCPVVSVPPAAGEVANGAAMCR